MKMVNRGWLKRQIAAGKIEARCNFSYTDDYAWDNATNFGRTEWLPMYLMEGWQDHRENQIGVHAEELQFESGRAYRVNEQEIRLSIHHNLLYTCRIVER